MTQIILIFFLYVLSPIDKFAYFEASFYTITVKNYMSYNLLPCEYVTSNIFLM